MGGHDCTQTRKMGIRAPERVGCERTDRHHRRCVRFLCRKHTACTAVVAGAWSGMVVPTDERAQKNVEKIYHRELLILMEYHKREIYIIT